MLHEYYTSDNKSTVVINEQKGRLSPPGQVPN